MADPGERRSSPAPRRGAGAQGQAAWKLWTLNWGTPSTGEHTITSRAYDTDGNVQPTPTDPYLTSKRTFWENNGHMTRRVMNPEGGQRVGLPASSTMTARRERSGVRCCSGTWARRPQRLKS